MILITQNFNKKKFFSLLISFIYLYMKLKLIIKNNLNIFNN